MSETIEFEANAFMVDRDMHDYSWVALRSIEGRKMLIDNAVDGGRFKVTLTPVEPELNPCPRCGGEMNLGNCGPREHWLVCAQCDRCSPCRRTRTDAITAHNARKCPELDPCPHCGGEWHHQRGITDHNARCTGCGHRTQVYKTQWDLAADVNRRA